MFTKLLFFLLFASFLLISPLKTFAQDEQTEPDQKALVSAGKQEILRGEVLKVDEESGREILGRQYPVQVVRVKIFEGAEKGQEVTIRHGERFSITQGRKVSTGEKIVLVKDTTIIGDETKVDYQIVDKYRLPQVAAITMVFALLVLALSRLRGLGSLVGLAISLLVIIKFIVPQILSGRDPLLVIIVGSFFIMLTTIYLAHGFSKRTTIALASTAFTLTTVVLLSVLFVKISKLSGLGNEDAASLQFGQATAGINFRGLLLGGMVIGALGVLDDITTSLATAVFELKRANEKLKFGELFSSGMAIGREHITSLVNTLLLAYAGASLPIFLFIVLNPSGQPMWFILNSEILMEEAIRTLAGSFGLVLAVPITAFLAASFIGKIKEIKIK